nr:hypothetical protein CFP56_11411 [Quercus suber]
MTSSCCDRPNPYESCHQKRTNRSSYRRSKLPYQEYGIPTSDHRHRGVAVPCRRVSTRDHFQLLRPFARIAGAKMASPPAQVQAQAQTQPTPPSEDAPFSAHASYIPHDLAYSAEFEDSLIDAILDPNPSDITSDGGICVLSPDSPTLPVSGTSIRLSDVSPQSLPFLPEAELPLPLNSPLRTFASPLRGIKLTHPFGYFEGGPGLDPTIDTFPDDFVAGHAEVETAKELRRAVEQEIASNVEVLRDRLRARREAKENNARIERELRTLLDQHSMERKIHAKMAEEKVRKREAREKRKKSGREGG